LKEKRRRKDGQLFPSSFSERQRQPLHATKVWWYSFQKLKAGPKPSKSETNDNALYGGAITVMNFIRQHQWGCSLSTFYLLVTTTMHAQTIHRILPLNFFYEIFLSFTSTVFTYDEN